MVENWRAYKPDTAHVRCMGVDPAAGSDITTWCIQLSTDATVIELALLMAAFCCSAEIIDASTLRLLPMKPQQPAPTDEQIRDVFERGLSDRGVRLKQVAAVA